MGLDQQGYFWLSDPWIAALAIVTAIGIVAWCHRFLLDENVEGSVTLPVLTDESLRSRRFNSAT